MANISFEEFKWFTPKPKSQLAITIPTPENLNLNSKLMEQMPRYIEIGIGAHGSRICIRESAANGYKLPKSGVIKDKDMVRYLVDAGIHLPARYTVTQEDGCWIAVLNACESASVNVKKPPRKPKRGSMVGFIKEVEAL